MNLHLQTTGVFAACTVLACVLGVGLLWLRDRSTYLRDWALSMLTLLLGFLLYGAAEQLPTLLGKVLANVLIVVSVLFTYTGYRRLLGLPVHERFQVLATAALFLAIWAVHSHALARMLFVNASVLVLSWLSLHLLLRQRRQAPQARQRPLSGTVLAMPAIAHGSSILVCLARMAYALTQDPSANTAGHSAQVLSLIVGAVGALAGAFGYTVLHGDRLRGELEHLARVDGLTGLPNRRAFDERLSQEWQRQRRHRTPLALMILDVDYFKRLNDELGHPVGDIALRRLGEALSKQVRAYDMVARVGGEEFCLLLPGCQAVDARARAQQLLKLDLNVPTPNGPRPFTLSIGITQARPDDADAQAMVARADEALYRAKQEGRHRCCEAE